MAQQLVAHVRFRRVKGFGVMANVLRRVKHPECESVEKVTRGQQAHHGAECEARALFEKPRDVLELWDMVRSVSAVLNQKLRVV